MFGNENPMGKTIRYENQIDLKVTGVTEEVPANSHFHYDYLVSFNIVEDYYGAEDILKNWHNNSFSTYILLKEGYDHKEFEGQLPSFLNKHMQTVDGDPVSNWTKLHLWPITDIHLYSNLDSEAEPNGSIEHIYIYSIIGIFILLIACINFMNLATARSARRAREVGLRKVLGAFQLTLIKQFLSESFLIAFFSLILAVVLVTISLPYLNDFVDKNLVLDFEPVNLLILLGITLLVGLISGSYPAFVLASFKPATVLKGINKPGSKQPFFRSLLVVLQFTISIVLIVGMIVVFQQLQYVKSKDLGFNKENVVVLPSNEKIAQEYESIKARLLNHPKIKSVTLVSRVPSGRLLDSGNAKVEIDGGMQQIHFRLADVSVDHDFLNTLEIPLVAGRNFNIELASDSLEAFILNESAVNAIGYSSPEEIIGKQMHYADRKGQIIGVAKNFHFESLHQPITPVILQIVRDRSIPVVVRLDENEKLATLSWLEDQWSLLRPDLPFNTYFIEDKFLDQYNAEEKLGKLIGYFSAIAILIACLGLLGLASFTTEQRTREIGIRKVLGASIAEILMLLLKGFTKLVIIAFIIACPLAYLGMENWLQNFYYHKDLHWLPFLVAGIFALLIAWGTVGFLTLKASLENPVKSLKTE
jgi:putative ABC transport system permease protein